MTKKQFLATAILALAVALTAIAPAYADSNSRNVNVPYAGSLSGTPLEAGRYTITWQHHSPSLTVTVANGKKVVATVPGRMEERANKFKCNMVLYTTRPDGSRIISEVRVGGTNQVIVFSE